MHFIHQTKNKIIKDHLIKSAYPTDQTAEYKWTKLSLIESHLLYALARHENRIISALPGTLDRIFKHLEEFKITFEPKLSCMGIDADKGYYVCNLDETRFDEVIQSSKQRWHAAGEKIMDAFNRFITSSIDETIFGEFVNQIRGCLYNTCAMPGSPDRFLHVFLNRVSCITIPPDLASTFKTFLESLQTTETPGITFLL